MSKWINNCGQILKSKKGTLYIKFDADFDVKKGDTLVMEKKVDALDKSVENGNITEERAEELKEKLHFVKYELHKGPRSE